MKYIKLFEEKKEDYLMDVGIFLRNFIGEICDRWFSKVDIYKKKPELNGYPERVEIRYTYNGKFNGLDILDKGFLLQIVHGDIDYIIEYILDINHGDQIPYDKIEDFKKNISKDGFDIWLEAKKYNL